MSIPPGFVIMEKLHQLWLTRALMIVTDLGVADRIGGTPCAADQIARDLSLDADGLYRLLRGLSSAGFFRELPGRHFAHTALSEPLRRETPGSVHHQVRVFGLKPFLEAWLNFEDSLRLPAPATAASSEPAPAPSPAGKATAFWQRLFAPEGAAELYQTAMSEICRLQLPAILGTLDLSSARSVADIGGGHGDLLAACLHKYPRLQGCLFDFPAVTRGAGPVLGSWIEGGRCRIQSGNMHETLPEKHDVYIMKNILHGLNDGAARTLLSRLRGQMEAHTRLYIIEMLIPENDGPHAGKIFDLFMLSELDGARVRTRKEFGLLIESAGFAPPDFKSTAIDLTIIEARPAGGTTAPGRPAGPACGSD